MLWPVCEGLAPDLADQIEAALDGDETVDQNEIGRQLQDLAQSARAQSARDMYATLSHAWTKWITSLNPPRLPNAEEAKRAFETAFAAAPQRVSDPPQAIKHAYAASGRPPLADILNLLLGLGIKAGEDAGKSDTGMRQFHELYGALQTAATKVLPNSVPYSKATARLVARGGLNKAEAQRLLDELAPNPTLAGAVMRQALHKQLEARMIPEGETSAREPARGELNPELAQQIKAALAGHAMSRERIDQQLQELATAARDRYGPLQQAWKAWITSRNKSNEDSAKQELEAALAKTQALAFEAPAALIRVDPPHNPAPPLARGASNLGKRSSPPMGKTPRPQKRQRLETINEEAITPRLEERRTSSLGKRAPYLTGYPEARRRTGDSDPIMTCFLRLALG
jgi:polyhydroxyalkanoate synthesis regulator phasin